MQSARRSLPTPGSTTATWTVPGGNHGAAWRSTSAPASTSCGGMPCDTSTTGDARRARRDHALHDADERVDEPEVGGERDQRSASSTAAHSSGNMISWWPVSWMPRPPVAVGRATTFTAGPVVADEVHVDGRDAPHPAADVAGQVERLDEHLGHERRPSRGSGRRRRRARRPRRRAAGSRAGCPAPIAAPSASGCMWMMSVPMATWTVAGMPARAAAARMLVRRCGSRAASMASPTARPRPEAARRRPRVVARFRNSPVSRAMPKRPRSRPGPDVLRRAAAPRQLEVVHEAGAVHRHGGEAPALDQVDDERPEPDLDGVRAHAEHDGLAARGSRARCASAASRRSRAARMSGSPARNARTLSPRAHGLAERRAATLLGRRPSGTVRTRARIDGDGRRADGAARSPAHAGSPKSRRSTSSQSTWPTRMCVSWMRGESVLAETRRLTSTMRRRARRRRRR